MVARLMGGGGGGGSSNWFSPIWSSWSLTMEFSVWIGFGLEKAPHTPAALRTSLSALYGRSLRRDIYQNRRDGRLDFYKLLLLFLNLLYHRLLYISRNQSHIINRHKQAIHSFEQMKSKTQRDTILGIGTARAETNTTPRGLLLRAWHDHPELHCHWSPHHEEMLAEWVTLTRTSFYEG
jgi:hypothetical protein